MEEDNSSSKNRHHFYEPKSPTMAKMTGFSRSDDKAPPIAVSPKSNPIIAAVEAGGTSFVVAICEVTSASSTILPTILHRQEFDSNHDAPGTTLEACARFLQEHKPKGGYHALGIASFGPLGVHVDDETSYGKILNSSPKAAWRNVDLLTPLQRACEGPNRPLQIKVDTDVNAPAYAEHLLRTNRQQSSTAYVTVGTGIGVGLVVHHQPVHGRMHPEGGHVPVQPLKGDVFGGYSWNDKSPFGGVNTVEGLACSVALTERLHAMEQSSDSSSSKDRSVLKDLPDNHEIWDHAANALANLCATLLLTLSMERIVLGGGLMNRYGLLEKIQQQTLKLLNGYLELPDIATVIVKSQFGPDAGLMGTIVLAQSALLANDPNNGTREDQKKMKRTAFKSGLWHGMLVGIVGTALLCKYWWMPRRK